MSRGTVSDAAEDAGSDPDDATPSQDATPSEIDAEPGESEPSEPDVSTEAGMDGGRDSAPRPDETGAPDTMDSGAPTVDAAIDAQAFGDATSELDGVVSPSDGGADDAADGHADAAPACSPQDLALWRAFQASGAVVMTSGDCSLEADRSCAQPACGLDRCLRSRWGVQTCETCAASEVACILQRCVTQCSASNGYETCRACSCSAGCIGAPSGCGSSVDDLCRDCLDGSCEDVRVDPSTIVQIFNYVNVVPPQLP